MKVGTRELKNRLSYYLRRVRESDEPIYVTDRGTVIAELKPVASEPQQDERAALLAMASRGDLAMGSGRFERARPVKLKRRILFSRRVIDDRR